MTTDTTPDKAQLPADWIAQFDELLEDYAQARVEVALFNARVRTAETVRLPRPRFKALHSHIAALTVPAAAPQSDAQARGLLQEFVDLCAAGDIDEDTDDGLGWGALVRGTKAFLASPTPAAAPLPAAHVQGACPSGTALSAPAPSGRPLQSHGAWISVDDQKPPAQEMVLVWVSAVRYAEDDHGQPHEQDCSTVDFGHWQSLVSEHAEPYMDNYLSSVGDSQAVTHWMPLPSAPTTGEQA